MKDKLIKTTKAICDLTTITSRCYCGGERIAFFSNTPYPEWLEDTFDRHKYKLETLSDPLTCITTEQRFYYGVLHFEDMFLVIGPVQDAIVTDDVRAQVACSLSNDAGEQQVILNLLRKCPVMSAYSMIPLLMNTNNMLFFKDEKNRLNSYDTFKRAGTDISLVDLDNELAEADHLEFNSFFTDIITRGDTEGMREWISNPIFSEGKLPLAKNDLRNTKDNFIVIATLFSEAAVHGGMTRPDAMGVLIEGIRQIELMKTDTEVLTHLMDLACRFTDSVHDILQSDHQNDLSGRAMQYIRQNINSQLRIANIADALFVSRGHLSQVFHAETGNTLAAYIKKSKVREACRLIETTDLSIVQISSKLSFSSQSHFTKVFREVIGMTPKEYRMQHRR